MSEPNIGLIVQQLKWVQKRFGNDPPPWHEDDDCKAIVKDIIKQLEKLPNASKASDPAEKGRLPVKPCWADANRIYEWGIKNLLPRHHNYRDILQAASQRGDAPKVRLPGNVATFGLYVRQYRRAMGKKSHRQRR
jgi:hypothetical protein